MSSKEHIIKRGLEEVIRDEELKSVLSRDKLVCYVGYEPTERIHVGWLVWILKLKDIQKAGIDIKILEATIHAWINDKGSIEELEEYKKNVRKIIEKLGIYATYIDSSEIITDPEYVRLLIQAAKNTTLDRVKRAIVVLKRRIEEVEQDFSKILYPLMQAVDAIYLNVDFALGSIDQKPAYTMSRDIAVRLGRKPVVILCTPLIPGLKAPLLEDIDNLDEVLVYAKMSSSRPDDAIFLDDDPETVERKIMSCPCKPKETLLNPILSIVKHVILPYYEKITIETKTKNVEITIDNAEEIDRLYRSGELTPEELKKACKDYLIEMLEKLK